MMEREKKRRFVLVHGAYHGAWCWYKVADLLKSSGHEVTALDMGASGINPKQMDELNSVTEYFEPLMEFLGSLAAEERVILVGHSVGGVCISVAMELFPTKIAAAVFVSAWLPAPDLTYLDLLQEDLTLALSLLRPFPILSDEDLQENTQLTRDNYGIVAKVYIVCEQDKMFKLDFQLFMIERNPPNDVKVIAGADHVSMFSKPQELFSYLQEIADTYY